MYEENLFGVDTTGVQQMGGYEVLPAGLYPAMMVSASKKLTKDQNGAYLECVYQIIDGDLTGKKFTSRMNLWNQNTQTVDIAKRELKSLRLALGLHDQESRTEMFVNKPLVLNIGVKPRKDKPTEPENNLINIEQYNGAPAQAAPIPQQYQPQSAPQPAYAPPQAFQQGAVGAGQMPPQQAQPQQRPAQPAFQPQAGQTPPWMVGAR